MFVLLSVVSETTNHDIGEVISPNVCSSLLGDLEPKRKENSTKHITTYALRGKCQIKSNILRGD